MGRQFAFVRAIACLAAANAVSCGSSGLSPTAPSDAESEATAYDASAACSCDSCPCTSPSDDAALIHVGDVGDGGDAASESGPGFVFIDAGCADGALAPQMGGPFLCGSEECFSGSQYCLRVAGGVQLAPGDPPPSGMPDGGFADCAGCTCAPLPCSCGAAPACACLNAHVLGFGNGDISCSAGDAGDLLVGVALP